MGGAQSNASSQAERFVHSNEPHPLDGYSVDEAAEFDEEESKPEGPLANGVARPAWLSESGLIFRFINELVHF